MTTKKNLPLLNEIFIKKKKPAASTASTLKIREDKKICWLLRNKNG